MAKIGRNDPCPCGSGRKFKKCCLTTAQARAATQSPPSLSLEVASLQQLAEAREESFKTLGVFILFSTRGGDGWLLEVTDMDAIQVAAAGKRLAAEIEEGTDTIAINWSHRFQIKDKQLVLTPYQEGEVLRLAKDYPTHRIQAAVRKIRQTIPAEMLERIHIEDKGDQAAATPES